MEDQNDAWPPPPSTPPPPDEGPKPKPSASRVTLRGVLAGVAVNLLCCGVFLLVAARRTAINHLSTFVLSYAPLVQGALAAAVVGGAARSVRRYRGATGLAVGLLSGLVAQLGCFLLWYQGWIQIYAG